MDFSGQSKSLWSVSSVFAAPLVLSSSSSIIGPLRFHPSPSPPTLLFTSPFLTPPLPLSLHPSLVRCFLHCLLKSNKTNFLPSSLTNILSLPPQPQLDAPPISRNSLHVIRRPNSDLILFFPAVPNHDHLSYVVFFMTKHQVWFDKDADVFKCQPTTLNHHIICISAIDVAASFYNHASPGFAEFKACISHACWNPHLQEECALILETGELLLFDLSPCLGASRPTPVKLRGILIEVLKDDSVSGQATWLACKFSWHSWTLILARSPHVFLVDFRFEENNTSCQN